MKITHSFNPVYDKDTKILILGSFPSVKSREENFYYMNKYNRFWKVISALYNVDLVNMDIDNKIKTLNQLHIGVYDVIYSCDIIGSKDSSIKDVTPCDIRKIINESKIEKVFLNGNKAYSLFIKYFKDLENIAYLLPSTSPANAKCGLDELIDKWSVITK